MIEEFEEHDILAKSHKMFEIFKVRAWELLLTFLKWRFVHVGMCERK